MVDRDARFRDVALLIEGLEAQRVAAEGDVLRALPFERSRERSWVRFAAVVADQLAVDAQRDAEDAQRAGREDVNRQRARVAELLRRRENHDLGPGEDSARFLQLV